MFWLIYKKTNFYEALLSYVVTSLQLIAPLQYMQLDDVSISRDTIIMGKKIERKKTLEWIRT